MTPEQTAHQQFLSFHQLPPMTAKMRESSTYPFDVTRISDTTQSSINPQPVFSNTLNLPLSLCNNDTQASLFHKNELNKQGTMFHSFHHNNNMTLPSSISGNNRKGIYFSLSLLYYIWLIM